MVMRGVAISCLHTCESLPPLTKAVPVGWAATHNTQDSCPDRTNLYVEHKHTAWRTCKRVHLRLVVDVILAAVHVVAGSDERARVWQKGEAADRLATPCQRVHKLARGGVKNVRVAVHAATRQQGAV